jgi:hypothetical protein
MYIDRPSLIRGMEPIGGMEQVGGANLLNNKLYTISMEGPFNKELFFYLYLGGGGQCSIVQGDVYLIERMIDPKWIQSPLTPYSSFSPHYSNLIYAQR